MTNEAHRVPEADAQPQPPLDFRGRRFVGREMRPHRQLGFFRVRNNKTSLAQKPRSRYYAATVCARIIPRGACTGELIFINVAGPGLAYRWRSSVARYF